MRVQLEVDSIYRQIDTRDPETMARWLLEQFNEIGRIWTPATFTRVQVWPSYDLDGRSGVDWIVNGAHNPPQLGTRTPRQFVNELADRLDQLGVPDEPEPEAAR